LLLESKLRPVAGIGWNEAPGGEHGGGSAPKKEATKQLMREAALRRYQDPEQRLKTQQIVKAAFVGIDRSGENNSHFGRTLSDEQKSRISKGRMGKGKGNSNWMKRKPYSLEALQKMSEGSKRRFKKEA
jgi:NUMOD3 motif